LSRFVVFAALVLSLLACVSSPVSWAGDGAPAVAQSSTQAATQAAPAATTQAAVSLLSNSDFSAATKDPAWPDDWSHPQGATWETEGDLHFLRLQSEKPGQSILVYRQMVLPSPPPAALEFRLRVRYSNIKPGEKKWFDGRIMGHFKDKAGEVVKPDPTTPVFTGSSKGWVDRTYFVKVPAGAHTLELMPTLFQAASGTLDFAKIEIDAASADKLPKPPPIVPSVTIAPPTTGQLPAELHVKGNELQTADGKSVWLQGLCVDSLQWAAAGDRIDKSVPVAIDQWKANVIRLPVDDNFWFGRGGHNQKQSDGGMKYRAVVDLAVANAESRGAYLVLDLHRFGAPMPAHAEFWKDAATRYKNHPGVIFELFNEPHDITWKVWRDGGNLKGAENKSGDVNVKENNEAIAGDVSVGMQALIDAVRSTGAKNIVIAGGLDWGYDLSGVLKGFALEDKGGDGIMYSSHLYPWKKGWQHNTLDAAAQYPIFVGEVGCPQKWEDFSFIKPAERYEDLSKGEWPPDVLGMIQKYKLNWTGFSFHPKCGPMVISDWDYTPTPYWGVYVKAALAGKQFEMKRLR